ncbi:hypothetical protein [Pseudohalioglobus lutimaris]|uniref:hypothetical protein n=1 Tax=Pseudohalioglobus lutimaris TaxID=1737061 RepID=UPI0013FD8688|nr:hypothetical protein [Pseudohalioglobus lutimaris]
MIMQVAEVWRNRLNRPGLRAWRTHKHRLRFGILPAFIKLLTIAALRLRREPGSAIRWSIVAGEGCRFLLQWLMR